MDTLLLLVYVAFLLWASWVDIRTLTIPSWITHYGTLLGIFSVTVYGNEILPQGARGQLLQFHTGFERVFGAASRHNFAELVLGFACLSVWFIASVHRPVRFRRGVGLAAWIWLRRAYALARRAEIGISFLFVFWLIFTIWIWKGPAWEFAFNSLLGCGFGILTCWIFRIGVSFSARQEALGFGDVHLQGMIGAWGGWQICVFNGVVGVCLLLPVVAFVTFYAMRRGLYAYPLPFGPFFALGALVLHFGWSYFLPVYLDTAESMQFFGMTLALVVVTGVFAILCTLLKLLLYLRS